MKKVNQGDASFFPHCESVSSKWTRMLPQVSLSLHTMDVQNDGQQHLQKD